jgi:uncharacterized alpha-E superfamily protein
MLSRTADNLFWMARYTERAENIARMLGVTMEASLLPQPVGRAEYGWRATLGVSQSQGQFDAEHRETSQKEILDFMVRDPGNPSSIVSCLHKARENARAVRGVLTTEVWEAQNATWLMLQRHLESDFVSRDPGRFFEWVKYRSHLSRGVIIGTMLKEESLYFIRLGTFLERADNTARILDVKFQGMPGGSGTEAAANDSVTADFYYWASLLRSVSGFEIYRKVYRDIITPQRVAELLILRADMPRSLAACMEEVVSDLALVRNSASHDTERLAGKLHSDLKFARIDEILESGLHAYLTRFLDQILALGNGIGRDFLVPPSV